MKAGKLNRFQNWNCQLRKSFNIEYCLMENENYKLYMGRKQEDAYLPNVMVLYRVTSNPYCEFNFKKIFTKPSGNVTVFIPKS